MRKFLLHISISPGLLYGKDNLPPLNNIEISIFFFEPPSSCILRRWMTYEIWRVGCMNNYGLFVLRCFFLDSAPLALTDLSKNLLFLWSIWSPLSLERHRERSVFSFLERAAVFLPCLLFFCAFAGVGGTGLIFDLRCVYFCVSGFDCFYFAFLLFFLFPFCSCAAFMVACFSKYSTQGGYVA